MTSYDINYVAMVAAAVVAFIIGWIWHSPMLFGKKWMELSQNKMSEKEMKAGMAKGAVITLVGLLLTSFVLAHMISFAGITTAMAGGWYAFFVWLGFVVPVTLMPVAWEKKPWGLFLINSVGILLELAVMAVIIVAMG